MKSAIQMSLSLFSLYIVYRENRAILSSMWSVTKIIFFQNVRYKSFTSLLLQNTAYKIDFYIIYIFLRYISYSLRHIKIVSAYEKKIQVKQLQINTIFLLIEFF